MGSGNFYLKPANTNKNVKGNRIIRSILFAGLLLISMPFAGKAQTAPTFVNGSPQTLTVCQNSGPVDITSLLGVSDPDGGEVESWAISTGAANGSAVGTGAEFSGGVATPTSSMTYTPNSFYTGPDMFIVSVTDGTFTVYTTINVVVTPLPSLNVDAIPAVCAGTTSTTLHYSSLSGVGPTSDIFASTGVSIWTAPPGVTSVTFDVQGAAGGGDSHSGVPNPGNGGRVTGDLTFAPMSTLELYVGGMGANGSTSGATGGWNGGGDAYFYFFGCGGAGGGASDIRIGGNALGNRVVVAGGGGGNGWDSPGASFGGAGGGNIGGSGGSNVGGGHAGGGTQSSGGAAAFYSGWSSGGNGTLGNGGAGSVQGISGGGGGGIWSGGGGGSSYANIGVTSSVVNTSGYNIGNGVISLSYVIPGTYTIIWDGFANAEGFVNVVAASFTPSPLTIAVPAGATPGTYTGTLTIANNTCTSNGIPISVTINPIPDVALPSNQVLCDGTPTSPIFFNGAVSGTAFDWTNDNPGIGLAASGTGNIGSFTATNTSASPLISTITVTPTANGCMGSPVSFTITSNPTPTLTSTLTPPAICDSVVMSYTPTSGTTGTTFIWFRNPVTGIANTGASGSGDPLEYLDNTSANPVTVTYMYTLAANGCVNNQNVNVTVYPTPTLNSSLTPPAICNHSLFSYTPVSLTTGTSFTWNRNIVSGISNSAATGTGNPNETLHNTTPNPVAVPYIYTMVANGCVFMQTVTVVVNPTPMLSSGLTPPAICNNTLFSYGPASATAGTTFSWSRGLITGISNPPNFGIDSINETLINTSPNPISVSYTYTMIANGCSSTQTVMVTVYPKPMLSSATATSVCDSTIFNYPPTSLTTGATYTWTRAVVSGISNLAGSGTGNPNERLNNTTSNSVLVTYIYTLMANGCTNTQNVVLTVHPTPTLSTSLTPPAICDSTKFSYNPASNTAGVAYTWFRPYIPGIYAVAATGTGNPNQNLINSTYVVVDVMYVYTLTANGCTNTQNVVVKVNPTPKLNPPYTAVVCSGYPFKYTPASYTPGAQYAWNRPAITNISPATNFGTGSVNETVVNNTLSPINVEYVYRLSINGCTNLYTQSVKLTVNPTPLTPEISIYPPSNLCSGTQYMNFGSSSPLPKVMYHWSATNAQVVAGSNNQYAIVSFNNPGTAVVRITSNVNGFGCSIDNSYAVNVNDGVSAKPDVIYFNNQFICLKNDNATYQWGYDDASTLDSTILNGEIDQNYNNNNPDFNNKHYWCMTTQGDCLQKTYYNTPTGITNINNGDMTDVKVYPNPSSALINVEIRSTTGGNEEVQILNMVGQTVATQTANNHKASINVADLASGVYLVDCYRNGVKIATTRFIKN